MGFSIRVSTPRAAAWKEQLKAFYPPALKYSEARQVSQGRRHETHLSREARITSKLERATPGGKSHSRTGGRSDPKHITIFITPSPYPVQQSQTCSPSLRSSSSCYQQPHLPPQWVIHPKLASTIVNTTASVTLISRRYVVLVLSGV